MNYLKFGDQKIYENMKSVYVKTFFENIGFAIYDHIKNTKKLSFKKNKEYRMISIFLLTDRKIENDSELLDILNGEMKK